MCSKTGETFDNFRKSGWEEQLLGGFTGLAKATGVIYWPVLGPKRSYVLGNCSLRILEDLRSNLLHSLHWFNHRQELFERKLHTILSLSLALGKDENNFMQQIFMSPLDYMINFIVENRGNFWRVWVKVRRNSVNLHIESESPCVYGEILVLFTWLAARLGVGCGVRTIIVSTRVPQQVKL